MKPPIYPENAAESTREWWSRKGIVYFAAAGDPAVAIKVGMTAQHPSNSLKETLSNRLAGIQTGNHELIRLLGVIYLTDGDFPGRDAEIFERELHTEFAHLMRFRRGCRGEEWFTADPSLFARIASIATNPSEFNLPTTYTDLATPKTP